MAERLGEELEQRTRRVFINCLDSFTSKHVAKFLSACVVEASLVSAGEKEDKEDVKHTRPRPDSQRGTFQIVGTVRSTPERSEPVYEEYFRPKREELLRHLMACDVIIYDITQHADQVDEAAWAVTALRDEMERVGGSKMFILISTMLTWARSRPVDPEDLEIPFTDDYYRRRRAHPSCDKHIHLERLVVRMGREGKMLRSYVVASGLQYGMGEQVFHFVFKMSWLGEEPATPVFGEGTNILPTIHIRDLASVIQNVIHHKPKPFYLLAVDNSNNSLEEIVTTVSRVLGPGKIQRVPEEDAFLTRDLTQMEIDSMLINLRTEAVHVKDSFTIDWVCEAGLVENIELVVEEYRQTRGLLPIRLLLCGPPAVGKSTVTEEVCKHYKLHHIKLEDTISETISHLEAVVNNDDPDAEDQDSVAEAKDLLASLKDSMEHNGGHLEDHFVIRVMKDKLQSTPCRNQGFVLDAFPETYEQAKELFCDGEDESEDTRHTIPPYNKHIIPDFVFCLDATDGLLKERVLNLPERLVEGTSYSQDRFLQCLANYRENNTEEETVLSCFDELGIVPQHIEITVSDGLDYLLVMERITRVVGQPRNYGPSNRELEEERRRANERIRREEQEKAEEARKETEEAAGRAARWEEWSKRLEEVKRQEEELLEEQSLPLRDYVMTNVMPTLTQGLIQCCRARPEDPLDFLAEYLFKNNPLNE